MRGDKKLKSAHGQPGRPALPYLGLSITEPAALAMVKYSAVAYGWPVADRDLNTVHSTVLHACLVDNYQ